MSTFLEGCEIRTSTPFPDGQPHVAFGPILSGGSYTLRCRIVSPTDLLNVGLAVEVLKTHGCTVHLDILYLMGGRMDRRLSEREPHTLKYVCGVINAMKVNSVRVFSHHSRSTVDLLDNYLELTDPFQEDTIYDMAAIRSVLDLNEDFRNSDYPLNGEVRNLVRSSRVTFVFPDEGAMKRYTKTKLLDWWPNANLVVLSKDRDERTGVVRGMKIIEGKPDKLCIILDDLCDGGATFKGASKCLKENGADKVALIVAHGIFSKGLPIEGIDWVGTTNSFRNENTCNADYFYRFA